MTKDDDSAKDGAPQPATIGRPRKNPIRVREGTSRTISGRNGDTKAEMIASGRYEAHKERARKTALRRERRRAFQSYLKLGVVRADEEILYLDDADFREKVIPRAKHAGKADEYIAAGKLKGEYRDRFILDEEFREAFTKDLAAERRLERGPVLVGEAVKRELAKRELARRKLLHFTIRNKPNYQAGWFHRDVCERYERFVEQVERQESPRLILAAPPRHGKSEIVSRQGPAWVMGKHPEWELINCSYAQSLALDMSRSVQDIVRAPDFTVLFPGSAIDKRQESAEDWATTAGGGMLAAGVGGPITGRGAHILTIDDPVKNRQDADSEIIRNTIYNWYTSTAYTRLAPGGGVIIMATRWHFDDLTGRLLTDMEIAEKIEKEMGQWPEEYDRWEVVVYPAIATKVEKFRKVGEPLHPERYSLPALKKIQRTLGPRDWAALYQQTPASEEGEYFKANWVRYYDSIDPSNLDIYAAGDLAISKEKSAAYTVFVVVGLSATDDIYILDLRRDRWDSLSILDEIFDIHKTWRPKLFGIEEEKIEKSIAPFIAKRIQEEKLWDLAIDPLPTGKRDKELRARPIQGRMKQGKVLLPRAAVWTPVLVNELLQFPSGKYADQVDALAWVGQMLMTMTHSNRPHQKKKSWKDKLHQYIQGARAAAGSAMAA